MLSLASSWMRNRTRSRAGTRSVKEWRRHLKLRTPQFEPLEQRQLLSVSIDNMGLISDTGASSTDRITADPRVQGIANGYFYVGHAEVEFDHDNDEIVDGYVSVLTPGGGFEYDPRSWDPSLNGFVGLLPMQYRWVEYDFYGSAVGTGSWTDFSITMESSNDPEIDVFDESQTSIYDGVTNVDFGSTNIGSPVQQTFTIHNNGTANLTLDAYSLSLPSGFSLITPFASTVAVGSSTTFTVELGATMPGSYNGVLSFGTNDPDEATFNFVIGGEVNVYGGGSNPTIEVAGDGYGGVYDGVSFITFGSTQAGVPVQKSFAINNTGDADLTLDPNSLTVPGGFSVVSAFGSTVVPGGSTSMTIQLDASAAGSYSGAVSFDTNDPLADPFNFTVMGQVDALQPEIEIFSDGYGAVHDGAAFIAFGSTQAGVAVQKSFTINNTGDADLTLDPNSLTVPGGFSVVSAFGSTVAPGGSTSMTIQLDASAAGNYIGAVSFDTNDPFADPFNFIVSGDVTGTPGPDIAVGLYDESMTTVNDLDQGYHGIWFGETMFGASVQKTLRIDNLGSADLTLDDQSLVLPTGFSVVTPFATTVAPGSSTDFCIQLDATAAGSYFNTVSFGTNDADEHPYVFAVAAEVVAADPVATVRVYDQWVTNATEVPYAAGLVDFGSTIVGSPLCMTFRVGNSGNADLALDPNGLTLPTGFSLIDDYEPTVVSGDWTEFTVQLDAAAAGTFSGMLSLATNQTQSTPYFFTVTGDVQLAEPELNVGLFDEWMLTTTDITDGAVDVSFGNTLTGNPLVQTLRISNTGTSDLTLDPGSLALPDGFSVATPFATTVAPGSWTTLGIQLDADSEGTFPGEMSFSSNDGDESPFNFSVTASVAELPAVVQIGLVDDTGADDSDGVSWQSTLTGQVVGGQFITVEFDENGDGLVDGFANADFDGLFQYQPTELPYGSVTVNARATRFCVEEGEYLVGPWTPLQLHLRSGAGAGDRRAMLAQRRRRLGL